MAESCFANAKFVKEDSAPKENMVAAISSTGRGNVNNAQEAHAPPKDGGDATSRHNNDGKKKKKISRQF